VVPGGPEGPPYGTGDGGSDEAHESCGRRCSRRGRFGVVAGDSPGGQISIGFARATRPGWWIVAALGLTVAALGYLTTTG